MCEFVRDEYDCFMDEMTAVNVVGTQKCKSHDKSVRVFIPVMVRRSQEERIAVLLM